MLSDPFSHLPLGMPREQAPPPNPFFLRGGLSLGASPSQGHMLSGMKDNAISSQGSHPPQSQMGMHHQATHNAVQDVQQSAQEDEGNFIEFDHAITFVTKIKRRFVHEPRVYQQFLEILHTYQKEQRGIKDVLEKVSALFADHPDLLKQFTYFLPEAVQEQAKERLNAAAAEAEARKMAAHTMETPQEVQSQSQTTKERDMEVTMDMTLKEPELIQAPPSEEKRSPSPPNVTLQYPMMPETLIYNSGVERQFFDLAKESLRSSSREGDLAWAEFLKCMDLYAQEILSKNDMLKYMEDLLGKQHIDLFEEFKRILSAAGAAGAPSHDEAWHSVPLSEIDFSRCRRCTPSYRALPRDYPAPPFSGRSADEAKLLNDVWISLPDGSEESYTFRHMRKNQHEEVLFRCEDERFEIDMVIDSTATALNRLEPIAEEIAMLQGKEDFSGRNTTDGNGLKTARENGGIGGKTIKYSFHKCVLNTIHRHAITRIYGESGQEMLDLMQKNPVVAIPVVVKRLKQKYKDFLAAREVLNRRWKELAEINYYKSIDHRSLTWRAVDKRATSTRTLAAEIKDRAANDGFESEATILAKRDKAKEEFGSFYERTMGRFLPRKMDLTGLPKPAPSIFTPHYSMSYENNSWAQRDAYRIISFALERGSTSPSDKERCHRLWIDFLAPFFDLSSIWVRAPAAAYAALPHHHAPSIVSNGDESANEDDESSAEDENEMLGNMMVTEELMKECNAENNHVTDFCLLDNQPIPSDASVSTIYGDGTVVEYRTSDNVFVVSLQCGLMAFLNRNAVLCTILPVDPYNDLEHPIETDEDPLERDNDKFILGPQSLYLFFRLHQILIQRLNTAKKLAYTVDKDQSLSTLIEQIIPDGSEHVGQKRYEAFLCLVYGLFDGVFNPSAGSNSAEGGKYEDRVRCLLGHNAYELATMDKLVSHILKHLQNLANDDTMQGMIQIFRKHFDSGVFKPQAFRQEAALISEGENIYAFQYCHTPKSDNAVMHIELLGCIAEVEDEESVTSVPDSNDGPASKKQRR
jgi:Histone deacetylase complex, SIN3 component